MPVGTGHYRVVPASQGLLPYVLVGPDSLPVAPVQDYLTELKASDCSPLTLKSYAYDLLDWFRFLDAARIAWENAERRHVRDWVLGAKTKTNPQRQRRADRPPAGSINPQTGKPSLRAGYAPATINHRLSVVAAFYDHQHRLGRGPAANPVPTKLRGENRRNAHHNPMEPWQPGPRAAYRQQAERRVPRAIPDQRYEELFAALTSDRDRAIVSLLVSAGARAGELLAMTGGDVDWGGQQVRLIGKGTREPGWVAASPAFFRWLAAHLAGERPPLAPTGPLWVTLRGPVRPLGYQALRAVLLRANEQLGTNWTLHDLRHTCALRLASDPNVPLVDVQAHLRHRHLTTTEAYLVARPEEVIRRVKAHQRGTPPVQAPPSPGWRYDAGDLEVLLGPGTQPP